MAHIEQPQGNVNRTLLCSFCGKTQREVRTLIAGPATYICDECVDLCVDILVDGGYGRRHFLRWYRGTWWNRLLLWLKPR